MTTRTRTQQADRAFPTGSGDYTANLDLPTRVRRLRRDLNLTQEQFGERLGVSVITIHRWETGQSRPRRLAIARLQEMEADHARRAARSQAEKRHSSRSFPHTTDPVLTPPVLDFNGDPDRFSSSPNACG